jgi:hypothetical protein
VLAAVGTVPVSVSAVTVVDVVVDVVFTLASGIGFNSGEMAARLTVRSCSGIIMKSSSIPGSLCGASSADSWNRD